MQPLPKFLFATGENLGAGLIVQTAQPLVFGRIIQFQDYLQLLAQLDKFIASSQVQGYSILIVYGGILGKGNVLQTSGDLRPPQATLDEMANFYLTEKVLPHKARFKRYLL